MTTIKQMMSSTPTGSPSGELNNADVLRSLRVGLTVLAAQAAVFVLQAVSQMNFGDRTVFVVAAATMGAELIRRKFVNNKGDASGN
jgi:hypothetical protein